MQRARGEGGRGGQEEAPSGGNTRGDERTTPRTLRRALATMTYPDNDGKPKRLKVDKRKTLRRRGEGGPDRRTDTACLARDNARLSLSSSFHAIISRRHTHAHSRELKIDDGLSRRRDTKYRERT